MDYDDFDFRVIEDFSEMMDDLLIISIKAGLDPMSPQQLINVWLNHKLSISYWRPVNWFHKDYCKASVALQSEIVSALSKYFSHYLGKPLPVIDGLIHLPNQWDGVVTAIIRHYLEKENT